MHPRTPLDGEPKTLILNRLKSARGHLEHVIAAVETDTPIIDGLRQLAAVRGALDATLRLALRHYLQNGFAEAVRSGTTDDAVSGLMGTLTFLKAPVDESAG